MQTIDGSAGTGSAVAYGDVGWVNMPLQTGWLFSGSRRQIFGEIRNSALLEDRSRLGNIVPERFPFGRIRQRRRKSQSECSCDGGALGFPGGWRELSKPVCEKWRLLRRPEAG